MIKIEYDVKETHVYIKLFNINIVLYPVNYMEFTKVTREISFRIYGHCNFCNSTIANNGVIRSGIG